MPGSKVPFHAGAAFADCPRVRVVLGIVMWTGGIWQGSCVPQANLVHGDGPGRFSVLSQSRPVAGNRK